MGHTSTMNCEFVQSEARMVNTRSMVNDYELCSSLVFGQPRLGHGPFETISMSSAEICQRRMEQL